MQVFIDQQCPRCGRLCGNGGIGMTTKCVCGWQGGLDPEDAALVAAFLRRAEMRDAAKGVKCGKPCSANWKGRCAAGTLCYGPILAVSAQPVSAEAAAELYGLLTQAFRNPGSEKRGDAK